MFWLDKKGESSLFKVSIDLGYGYVKGLNQDGDQVRFPSLVSVGQDRFLSQLMDSMDNTLGELEIRYEDKEEKGHFFVGELAKGSKTNYVFDQNKISHLYTKILLSTAAAILSPKQDKIWLGAGLPLQFYKGQKEEFNNMLSGFQSKISVPHMKIVKEIRFEKVSIYAQGVSSVYDGLIYPNGKPRYPEFVRQGNLISALNWGTRTVDVVVFEVSRTGFNIRPELSFTLDDAGAMEIRRRVQESFQQETGYPISLVKVEDVIDQNGYVFFKGREYDFSEQINGAKRNIVRLVIEGLNSKWGSDAGFIRALFMAGGTVADLKGFIQPEQMPIQTIIVDDPQFADARGTMHIMRMEERIQSVS